MSLIRDLHHINIRTPDLARTKALFMDVLGLTEGWRPGTSGRPGAWLYAGARPIVHVTEVDEPPARSQGGSLDHIAFEITDYEVVLSRIERAGLEFRTFGSPETPRRQILVEDASGATVELQWVNPRASLTGPDARP